MCKRLLQSALLWLLDVVVAVFIGPVDNGEHTRRIRQFASRRRAYAVGIACVMFLMTTIYAIAFKWAKTGSY